MPQKINVCTILLIEKELLEEIYYYNSINTFASQENKIVDFIKITY